MENFQQNSYITLLRLLNIRQWPNYSLHIYVCICRYIAILAHLVFITNEQGSSWLFQAPKLLSLVHSFLAKAAAAINVGSDKALLYFVLFCFCSRTLFLLLLLFFCYFCLCFFNCCRSHIKVVNNFNKAFSASGCKVKVHL